MIVRERPSLTQLFFVMQGSIVPAIAPTLIIVVGFSLAVFVIDKYIHSFPHVAMEPLSVFGVALSLFLGFRNNAAYDRWWEARKLWGQLVSDFRNFGRETRIFLGDSQERTAMLKLACAYVHFHRGHLRTCDVKDIVSEWIEERQISNFQSSQSPACAVLEDMASRINQLSREEKISGFGEVVLAQRLASISDAQAGCERIASTPLPFVYSLLVHRTAYLYCLFVPFGLIENAGWMTPVFAGFIAYVFFGLTAVTEELEHPFNREANGIPLDALCRNIEISLSEAMDCEPPDQYQPKDHVLT